MSRWLISVPAWGDAYVDKFKATALPTLQLAAANVVGERLLVVHTDRPHQVAGMSSEVLPIEARAIHVSGDGYYVTMSNAHRDVIAMARPGDAVVIMPADAVISANALAACAAAFARGKKVVAVCPVRAFDDAGRPPVEDPRALLEHAWLNRHHIVRNSTWPGDGGGHELHRIFFDGGADVVARQWLPHPLAFLADGRAVTFGNSPDLDLIGNNFRPDEVHVVTDPDEMAFVALEPRSRMLAPEPPISERLRGERLSPLQLWMLSHRVCIRGRDVALGDAAAVAHLFMRETDR